MRNGLVPVFCDINPIDYTIDANKIENLITEKTVAIVPVHVYGNLCDVERIDEIAKRHNLKVIYDAAHAFAVRYKGISAANFGDASMFSFHATKVFNTIEGGAVCLKNSNLVPLLNDIKNFGIHGPESIPYIGVNAKMNEFQAAMGVCNLRHIEREIQKRRQLYEEYYRRLIDVEGIRLCRPKEGVEMNYAYFPVVFDSFRVSRDMVYETLANQGIFTRKYFYPLTNDIEAYRNIPTADSHNTPVASFIADRVLTLPMYADLAMKDVDRICDIIVSCMR